MQPLLRRRVAAALLLVAACPSAALAHAGAPLAPHDLRGAWTLSLPIVLPLAATIVLYALGIRALWRRAGAGRGVRVWEATAFLLGWLALVAALVSPLHALGEALFAAHMAQHELLMTVGAPLLVLGRPLVPTLFALSPAGRQRVTGWAQLAPVRGAWSTITRPGMAWTLHAAAIWGWHVPWAYQLALRSEAAHALQHVCFLGTALLFWWTVLHPAWSARGVSLLSLFTTMLHTGALGAILAVSPTLWYPAYGLAGRAWGLTPLDDQQLGGMIMWIPGGIAYLIAALAMLAATLRESERRARPWTDHGTLEVGWRAS